MRNLYDKTCCWCKGHVRAGEGQAWNYRGRWYAGCPTCLEERKAAKDKKAKAVEDTSEDIRIEYPSVGATYHNNCYGVYKYYEAPLSSILAGTECREWLGEYETLAEAQKAYPFASNPAGTGYRKQSFTHLSEEED